MGSVFATDSSHTSGSEARSRRSKQRSISRAWHSFDGPLQSSLSFSSRDPSLRLVALSCLMAVWPCRGSRERSSTAAPSPEKATHNVHQSARLHSVSFPLTFITHNLQDTTVMQFNVEQHNKTNQKKKRKERLHQTRPTANLPSLDTFMQR